MNCMVSGFQAKSGIAVKTVCTDKYEKKNDLRNALFKLIEFPRVTYFTGLL